MKNIRYIFESLALHLLFFLFRILPLDRASAFGGWIGRTIGPRLAASRKARHNIEKALPDKTTDEQTQILIGMWDNLGRIIAEYPHLEQIGRERVSLEGGDILKQLRDDGLPAILFGAHMANWEVAAAGFMIQCDLPVDLVYRAPNNPWVEKLLHNARSMGHQLKTYPKSKTGTRQLVRAMKDKRHVGILIDQKYNEGVPALFFNRPAMTSPAFIQLCQKFKCPLVPTYVERLGNRAQFKIRVLSPLELFDKNQTPVPVEDAIKTAHTYLEEWITKNPEQWLWLHRRWSSQADEKYQAQQTKAA